MGLMGSSIFRSALTDKIVMPFVWLFVESMVKLNKRVIGIGIFCRGRVFGSSKERQAPLVAKLIYGASREKALLAWQT